MQIKKKRLHSRILKNKTNNQDRMDEAIYAYTRGHGFFSINHCYTGYYYSNKSLSYFIFTMWWWNFKVIKDFKNCILDAISFCREWRNKMAVSHESWVVSHYVLTKSVHTSGPPGLSGLTSCSAGNNMNGAICT